MAGYVGGGAPLPGSQWRLPAPRYGPQYAAPRPPEDLVSSRTPVANKLVEGINSFVSGFRDVKDAEEKRAREQALQNIEMAQLGFPIDMKKTARLLRRGGLDLNYDAMPQQSAPLPGPTPQQQQAAQQFSAAGMMGGPQAIAGAMAGGMPPGGDMPQGGGAPIPGKQGGNFFQRFGRAITEPFRNQGGGAPMPGQRDTVVEALQRIQQAGATEQQMQAIKTQVGLEMAKSMQTFIGGEVGSPEWMRSTQFLYSLDKIKELPMDYKVRELQKFGVKDEREAARLIYAAENINLPGGPNPEADRNAMAFVNAFQRSHANADPSKALIGYRQMIKAKDEKDLLAIDWGLSDNKDDQESLKATRTEFQKLEKEYTKAPAGALWSAATYLLGGDIQAYDDTLKPFGPGRTSEEAERQKARELREQAKFAQDKSEQQINEQVEDYSNRLFQEAHGDIGAAIRKLGQYQQDINAPYQYRAFATRIRERLEDIARGGRSGVEVRVSSVPAGPPGDGDLDDEDLERLRRRNP